MRQSSATTLKTEQTRFLAQTIGSAGKTVLWRASWSDHYEMSGSDGTSRDPKRNRSTHPPLAGTKSSRTLSRLFLTSAPADSEAIGSLCIAHRRLGQLPLLEAWYLQA